MPPRGSKLIGKQPAELEEAVAAATVARSLRAHCGEDWMVRAGFSGPECDKRLEFVIRYWLKQTLGVPQKSSRQKKGLAVDLHKDWEEGRTAKEFFQSEHVIARWTTETGTIDPKFRGHYVATVIGDARNVGEYRLLFAAISDGDEERPPQEHPCVPVRHIMSDEAFVRAWEAEHAGGGA